MLSMLRRCRFTPLRRVPFPALALGVCLVFAAVGAGVLDDYGVGADETHHRETSIAIADYILGNPYEFPTEHDRFYGATFEMLLLLAERGLGLQDSRSIHLVRHIMIHLFFIVGGFCCGLLAYRMFGSRWIALLAMLLFLLHPRLYAHSFFNSKDPPFAAMFMIALYFTHRAFRKDTLGAFALCGAAVALTANMRIFGLILPPMILAMRGLDWRFAVGAAQRQRIIITGAAFLAAGAFTIYIISPFLWENPFRAVDWVAILSQHPTRVVNLFMGRIVVADEVPPHYIPVWFMITAPAAALLLGGAGAAAVCWRAFRGPIAALRSGELRFLVLSLGCFVLPIAVVIVLQSNTYNGWRHFYFLWGPFCLLAAAGLHWLAGNGGGKRWDGRRYRMLRRVVVYGAAGAGIFSIGAAMVSLHPNQHVYFNALVDRETPGRLAGRFDLGYWEPSLLQGLKYLLERYPDATVNVLDRPPVVRNLPILPAAERGRIALSEGWAADFHVGNDINMRARAMASEPAVYTIRAYGSDLLAVVAPRLVWGDGVRPGEDAYRAAYRAVTAAGDPAARSDFEVYIDDGALYYVKDDCGPADTAARVVLHLYPVDKGDLPAYRREYGFDNRSFNFDWRGGYFDGKCITQEPLPDYPVARIRTGQWVPGEGDIWQAEFRVGGLGGGR